MSRLKSFLLNMLIAAASLVLLIAALEFTARLLLPETRVRLVGGDLFVKGKAHPRSMVPNFKGKLISPEYAVPVTTNSMGLRDFEYPLKKTTKVYRILAIGDSFTWGWGVRAKDTYAKVLERLLDTHSRDGTRYEVINMAMPNTATLEEIEVIKEGLKYQPDLVLIGFLAEDRWSQNGNDLYDNVVYWKRLGRKDTKKISRRATEPSLLSRSRKYVLAKLNDVWGFLQKHSRGFSYVMTKAGTFLRTSLVGLREGGHEKELGKAWKITQSAFLEIDALAKQHHFNVVIVRIPFLYDVSTKETDKVSEVLSEFSRKHGLAFFDLLPLLHRHKTKRLYFSADGHWTPLAHKVSAEGIYHFLVSENILGADVRD
ncbi:MAG: GDSL-type esterase/lipase family protein [bacterium]|nr:GDSL-type esterase/lipase family protein [bacterium]